MSENMEKASENSSSQKLSVKRVRAPNFNVNETLKLEELVKENYAVINSKLTNQITNNLKSEVWRDISIQVSALGFAQRSEQACLEKWANLKRKAKEDMCKEKLERRKTGGGSAVSASEQSKRIADMFSCSASFSGIQGGLDTDEPDGLHYISNESSGEPKQGNGIPDKSTSYTTPSAKVSANPSTSSEKSCDDVHAVSTLTNQASNSSSLNTLKRGSKNTLIARKHVKRSKSETLMDYQIAYYKGMVERQDLDRELSEVKLRILKAAEKKISDLNASELLNMLSDCEQ